MENKSDYAYQELKNRIISGQMPPLSDVSEEQLQKELGVSRTPIREAIQKLEKEHFVMIYPRRGTLVSDITLDLIYSIYEVRLLNEPFIARSACRYIVNEWIDHMTPPSPQHFMKRKANSSGIITLSWTGNFTIP